MKSALLAFILATSSIAPEIHPAADGGLPAFCDLDGDGVAGKQCGGDDCDDADGQGRHCPLGDCQAPSCKDPRDPPPPPLGQ